MKRKLQFLKTLLVAVGLCVGASDAWAYDWTEVASYDFESGLTSPFTNESGSTRWTITNVANATVGSKVINFTNSNSLYGAGYAYAVFDFTSLTSGASAVKVEFDFLADGLYSCFSLRDGSATPGHNKSTGYGKGGSFISIGSMRIGGQNVFGVNGTTVSEGTLNTWYHAELIADVAAGKAYYTLKNLSGTTVKTTTEVSFYGTGASACTQFDFFSTSGGATNHVMGSVDNIVVSKYVDASNHNYTINAVCDGSTLTELASGICAEGAEYSAVVNKAILYNGKYYVLSDASVSGYTTEAYTMGASDETKEITYTLDESIVFFKEGETLSQSTANVSCSGGAYSYYYAGPFDISITDAGTYQLETYVVDRNTKSSLEVYTNFSTTSIAQIAKNCSLGANSCSFVAGASSTMRVGGPYYEGKFQNSLSFDYILIRKTGDAHTISATLGANGYTTFASSYPLDLTTANLPAGVKAYKAAVDGTVVRFTELNQTVPANTGILLEGTAGATVSIPVVASGDAVTGNAFLVNTTNATITSDASTYYFAMVKDSNPLKFGKVNSVNIPANKAYLQVPATNFTGTAPALTAIFDDGNTTGINAVKNAQFTENGEYYNLAGQRVAQPTKGLYIVNGRKVVVK